MTTFKLTLSEYLQKGCYTNSFILDGPIDGFHMTLTLVSDIEESTKMCFFMLLVGTTYFFTDTFNYAEISKMLSQDEPNHETSLFDLIQLASIELEFNSFPLNPIAISINSWRIQQGSIVLKFNWIPQDRLSVAYHIVSRIASQQKHLTFQYELLKKNLDALTYKVEEQTKSINDNFNLINDNEELARENQIMLQNLHQENLIYENELGKIRDDYQKQSLITQKTAADVEGLVDLQSNVNQHKNELQKYLNTLDTRITITELSLPTFWEIENVLIELAVYKKILEKKLKAILITLDNASRFNPFIKQLEQDQAAQFNCDGSSQIIKNAASPIYCCIDISESEYLVGYFDGNIELIDKHSQISTKTIKGLSKWIYTMIKFDDNLAVGGGSNEIEVFSIMKNEITYQTSLIGHSKPVLIVVQVKDSIIASASNDKLIKLWDIKTSKCIFTIKNLNASFRSMIMFTKRILLGVGDDSTIRQWDVTDISNVCELQNLRITEENPLTAVLHLKDSVIAVGNNNGGLSIWDLNAKKGRLLASLFEHTAYIRQIVRLSNSLISTCSGDFSIIIWSLVEMKMISNLKKHTSFVFGIIRLNNSQLLSVSNDKTIRIWGSSPN